MRVLLVFLFLYPLSIFAQNKVSGLVLGVSENKIDTLVGANVYWLNQNQGTTTDINGRFTLKQKANDHMLVVSFVGYKADTIHIHESFVEVKLLASGMLGEYEVTHRQMATTISKMDPIKTEILGQKELRKAACCNLSESFETNPTVDVSYGDAVTGTRQITMLGLSGRYSMISRELIPSVRTLNNIQGLQFIPGPWIESIQVAKGAGSVVHGFESMSGQINVELFKPETADQLYFNAYTNTGLRQEINLVSGQTINENVHTALFVHLNGRFGEFDMNNDNFLDMPTGRQANVMNRWQFYTNNGWEAQLGIHGIYDEREAGEFQLPENEIRPLYEIKMRERMLDVFAKAGYNFERPSTSLGFQLNGRTHNNQSTFGNRMYDGEQNSLFFNSIFQSYIGNTNHQYKIGSTTQIDDFNESIIDTSFNRTEWSTGVFAEYAFTPSERFNLILGGRADYHNFFGVFFTPRLHSRCAITENTILRVSGGRGQRTANVLADQFRFFASSRALRILPNADNLPFGLNPEVSYNYGLNLTHDFTLNYRDGYFSVDLYRTDFMSRVVADFDHNPQELLVYNVENLSYANSVQVELAYEPVKRLDVKLAYRFFESRTQYTRGWLQHPGLSRHRAFGNVAYETKNEKWFFDLTAIWTGSQRLAFTDLNPVEFQFPNEVPDYWMFNAQIAFMPNPKTEWYVGFENFTNFRIDKAINSPENPFRPYFDTTFAWGPIFGAMVYAGVRYRIPRAEKK
jgi:outer membrane receptor for ferrienterochelin and colicins